MKANLLINTKELETTALEKYLLQGVVDNVFSNLTEEDVLSMWRELKAMAVLEVHDDKSRLMAIYDKLRVVFSTLMNEYVELDCFGISFDVGDKPIVLTAGSGVRVFGLEPDAVDWNWTKDQLACFEPKEVEGIEFGEIE